MPHATRTQTIAQPYKDATVNLVLHTIAQQRQCLVFVSSKASAEKVAMQLVPKLKQPVEQELHDAALSAVNPPTDQCEKLATCLSKRVAFHHSGLASAQRALVEDAFRDNKIHVIVCTPTLAAGVDLPAFRTIIRDVKRFTGSWGMQFIPVLEYQQMAGRAGRPGKETHGESIMVASYASDVHALHERFIAGEVEPIQSKLAVEPVLRMHTLALIASEHVPHYDGLLSFFDKTFYAHQFGDKAYLKKIIQRILGQLRTWGFVEHPAGFVPDQTEQAFVSADTLQQETTDGTEGLSSQTVPLRATRLGRRVSELYLDPLTAHQYLQGIQRMNKNVSLFSIIQLLCTSIQARPLFRVGQKEQAMFTAQAHEQELLVDTPSVYEPDYADYLCSIKSATVIEAWCHEVPEQRIMEQYNVRPGELRAKTDMLDWLLMSCKELARIRGHHDVLTALEKARIQIQFGVKEELLTLISLHNIGRVRARKLFAHGITSPSKVVATSLQELQRLLGPKLGEQLKLAVGDSKHKQQQTIQ